MMDYSTLINGDEPMLASEPVMGINEDNWTLDYRYKQGNYIDESYSRVDSSKQITLDKGQITVTQDHNSQYIPFEMSQYYDGLDLAKGNISVNFLRSDKKGKEVPPINVRYNGSKIRFGWLLNEEVTSKDGSVDFEILVRGLNEFNEPYLWKTQPATGLLKVLKGLVGGAVVNIDDSWMQEIVDRFADVVANAELGLQNYYTKQEVNNLLDNVTVDLTGYATEGYVDDKIDELATVATSGSYNDLVDKPAIPSIEGLVKEQTLNDRFDELAGVATSGSYNDLIDKPTIPSIEGLINEQTLNDKIGDIGESENIADYVTNAIAEVDVSEQLGDLGVNVDEEGKETPKTVKQYVDESIDGLADVAASGDYNDLTNKPEIPSIEGLVHEDRLGNIPIDKTVKEYVDESVASVDVTEQLKDYYTKTEVDEKVNNVSVDLSDYYTKSETDGKVNSSINNALGELLNEEGESITVKEYVDSQVTTGGEQNFYKATYGDAEIEGQTQKNIFTLWTAKEDFNPEQPGDTVVSIASQFQITGGSGGGDSNLNKLTIYYDTSKNGTLLNKYAFREEDVNNKKAIINYTFTGVEPNGATIASADATWEYRRGTSGSWKVAKTETIAPTEEGKKLSFNISEFLTDLTSYQFRLKVVDASGAVASASWTVQKIAFRIETNFDDKKAYKIGDIPFYYTPYGASIEKTIYFKWDNKTLGEVKTSRSGAELEYILPINSIVEQARHGSHLLEVYMTATINGELVTSEYVYKDIILFDSTRTVPVIGCAPQNYTIPQYSTLNIEYAVYDPTTNYPKVVIDVDGKAEEKTLETAVNPLAFKSDVVATHTITITCTNEKAAVPAIKVITVEVTELGYEIAPVPGAVIDFDPVGKMNSDRTSADNGQWKVWNNDNYSLIASTDFDWINGGFQTEKDESGKTITGTEHFRIKAGDRAYFDYKFFGGDRAAGTELDPKESGKDFKIIFKTEKVRRAEAKFLTCVSENNGNPIGMEMYVHEGYIHCGGGSLRLPYSEGDIIEYGFKIEASNKENPVVMGYEDGVTTSAFVYGGGHSFVQTESDRKYIELGSDDCDLLIYRVKIYEKELKDSDILKNFIADARTGEEMIDRHERNLIYNDDEKLDPVTLSKKCPWLRVITISAPHLTQDKDNKVGGTTIEYRYENGKKDGSISYWKCVDGIHRGQGTSSNLYGVAGRNLDLVLKADDSIGNNPIIYLDEEETITTKKVALTTKSVPVNYFNVKVNIASSENANNALLQKRFNTYQPYKRPFLRDEGEDTSIIKDTMEFFNCVVFVQETDETLRKEFDNGDYNFYAIGNIGDSKKTDKTRLTDPDDEYECCLEIADVALPLSDFPVDTIVNAMRYEVDTEGKKEYLFATDENLQAGLLLVKDEATGQYVQATGETVDVDNVIYYIDGKAAEDFGGDFTYEWRHITEYDPEDFLEEGVTEEEAKAAADAKNSEIATYCADRWWEFYNFVTQTSDADFKKYFDNFFVRDSALYYYLFTTRYTMVDNRAKNSFWHYGKIGGTYDKDITYTDANGKVIFSAKAGDPIRKWDLNWGYDMDTALGTDNDGDMVYRYGYEDIDVDEDGVEIFRESDSTFFCRLRDNFSSELATKYSDLNAAWSADNLIKQFDDWQSQFPEALWKEDIYRKYIRTRTIDKKYLDNMANGKKKYQRRQFERNQEKYMASKYRPASATSSNIIAFRTADTSNDVLAVPVNYDFTIRPYAYMYIVVNYLGQGLARVRVTELDKDYTLTYPGQGRPDFINVESAHWIESLGDLSAKYFSSITTESAEKLKELNIGSDDFIDYGDNNILTYYNKYLTTLTLNKRNELLEKINIENVKYDNALDVSMLPNLQEVYANGSSITGFVGANGGALTTVQLPDISTLTLKNLSLITEFSLEGTQKLTTLNIENCDTIDWPTIINNAPNLNNFRMTGINWSLDNDEILSRVYEMSNYSGLGNSELAGYIELGSVKERDLAKYRERWKDLEIVPGYVQKQYRVTYENPDGSVWTELEEWVVERETATKPEFIPTQTSTAQYNYEFKYWRAEDSVEEFNFETKIMSNLVLVAEYTPIIRKYTVRYLGAKGEELQKTTNVAYGSYVDYNDAAPTDLSQENIGIYSLFAGWDKSGYVTGDKDINSVWETYVYGENTISGTTLENTALNELRPVELYALLKEKGDEWLCKQYEDYGDTDVVNIQMGETYDNFTDLNPTDYRYAIKQYTGSDQSYYDTKESLFEEDKDFVFVIDYKMLPVEGVLLSNYAQNFGLKLVSEGGVQKLIWGKSSINLTSGQNREVLVIMHKKGETAINYYFSNKANQTIMEGKLEEDDFISVQVPLTFGAEKSGNNYTNKSQGEIFWVRKFNGLLGAEQCRELASWPHEKIEMFPCIESVDAITKRMKNYPISNDLLNGKTRMTLMSTYVLETPILFGSGYQPKWSESDIRSYLNNRLVKAINPLWRQLLKQADIPTVVGENNNNAQITQDYIYLPAINYLTGNGYSSEGKKITCFPTVDSRIVYKTDGKTKVEYWVRSSKNSYRQYVNTSGEIVDEWAYNSASPKYIRMMLNF